MTFEAALEALTRPLEFVTRDGFVNLDRVRDFGDSVETAAKKLVTFLPSEDRTRWASWVRDVRRWNVLPRPERERLAAMGLRLCAGATIKIAPMPASKPRQAPVASGAKDKASAKAKEPAAQGLSTPLAGMPGVGPSTEAKLAARGLVTVGDLLYLLPRRWDDLRSVARIGALTDGETQVTRGVVVATRVKFAFRRRILEVVFSENPEDVLAPTLLARWFQFRGSMQERFPKDARFVISGKPRLYKNVMQMVHPETMREDDDLGANGASVSLGVRVRYPEVEGVPGRVIEKLCRHVAERFAKEIPDGLPSEVAAQNGFVSQGDAIATLHLPDPAASSDHLAQLNLGVSPPQQRLVFDEFFFLQLGLARRRGSVRRETGCAFPAAKKPRALDAMIRALPFSLTGAQARALEALRADLVQPHPMHRLLQGDVGSGKTVVAWGAAELAAQSGYQSALMAPTELLAEQHSRTLKPWAEATGRRIALLTASTPRPERESTLALCAAGKIDLIVGTHALLADRVGFSQLGLVIIDEQHRFGVEQRATLRQKHTGIAPHLLVMTATPIPRTYALTIYGDLDVTKLDELPPGREAPDTRVLHGKTARDRALAAVEDALDKDTQAYWVCPLIEESDKLDLADVTQAHAWLSNQLAVPVGLMHGRLSAKERDDVMQRFRAGELRVLVATTVIEVGVDVPRASLMVIEGAERFGLSQLHQLRGRVGRGGGKARCLLVAEKRGGDDARDRLRVMEDTGDGFEVAEADLRIRGPGEIFGTRQAGLPRLRYADLVRDIELLKRAREDAFALLERDPELSDPAHARTRSVLDSRWASGQLFGEEAG